MLWRATEDAREGMSAAASKKQQKVHVAVIESDPLRFVGFRSLFEDEPELELVAASLAEVTTSPTLDVVLLGTRNERNLFDIMAGMKAARPGLRIIVTGSGMDDRSEERRVGKECRL